MMIFSVIFVRLYVYVVIVVLGAWALVSMYSVVCMYVCMLVLFFGGESSLDLLPCLEVFRVSSA